MADDVARRASWSIRKNRYLNDTEYTICRKENGREEGVGGFIGLQQLAGFGDVLRRELEANGEWMSEAMQAEYREIIGAIEKEERKARACR